MIMHNTISPEAVKELLAALDSEIALMEERLGLFTQLYRATLSRDNRAMESSLAGMERLEQRQQQVDQLLQLLRRRLAADMPASEEEFSLVRLSERLEERERQGLQERRKRILRLAEEVRREHRRTSLLLSECARVNRMLLKAFFPQEESCVTYRSGGAEVWKGSSTLLDTER